MKTFKEFNKSNKDVCPICKTNDDGDIVLVPIHGTESDGNIKAKQFHLGCMMDNLVYYEQNQFIIGNCK